MIWLVVACIASASFGATLGIIVMGALCNGAMEDQRRAGGQAGGPARHVSRGVTGARDDRVSGPSVPSLRGRA